MVYVSIGGISPKGWRAMPRFYFHAFRSFLQAKRHPDCLVAELTRSKGVFFAFSVWENADAKRIFASSGAHAAALKVKSEIVTAFDNLSYETETAPSVQEAIEKWFAKRVD